MGLGLWRLAPLPATPEKLGRFRFYKGFYRGLRVDGLGFGVKGLRVYKGLGFLGFLGGISS